jgi:ATP-dependent exoDNAse (exonuclease V) alpha subunit
MIDIPDEKHMILNAIRAKHNVCITGAAGTGKSFLLQMVKEHFSHVHITASTGVAAVNVGGVTIHSWAGIGKASFPPEEIAKFINSGPGTKIRRQIKKAKLLAIDEISMISAQVFNLLNQVFQLVRENEQPFGGIQIVILGDFFQLPPVSHDNHVDFCFSSDAWDEADFKIFELAEIFRQSDLRFIQLLNNMRRAALNEEDLDLLHGRQNLNILEEHNPTILVTHNYQAEKINIDKLRTLDAEEKYAFKMSEKGKDNAVAFLKKNCLAQEELVLKLGAQVMMLKNSLQKQGIINGSIGIIIGFSRKEHLPMVKFRNGEICVVAPEEWNVEVFNEMTQEKEITGSIKQLPLILAWAITIHKSQGMTLDNVLCDLSNIFAEGQAYVALSRVKSLDGLYLKGFKASALKVNKQVLEFYNDID